MLSSEIYLSLYIIVFSIPLSYSQQNHVFFAMPVGVPAKPLHSYGDAVF